MTKYMIPPKMFSLTTLPGAFIIIFMFLMLPFFLARELGWQWVVDANLIAIIVSSAIPSLCAALWIARWVEKRQSEESIEIDDEGVTSTMRTRPHPDAQRPLKTESQHSQALTTPVKQDLRRVLWQDVRTVELRSRRSARIPGTYYQVCLITDNDILPIPLNDEAMGTRPMVEVDSEGHPSARHNGGKYPGVQIVQEIHRYVSEVPWTVKKEFAGKYDRKEKQLAFTGIDDPWSGETISEPDVSGPRRKQMLILSVILTVLISMIVCGFILYHRSKLMSEREREEALRKLKANMELKVMDKSIP